MKIDDNELQAKLDQQRLQYEGSLSIKNAGESSDQERMYRHMYAHLEHIDVPNLSTSFLSNTMKHVKAYASRRAMFEQIFQIGGAGILFLISFLWVGKYIHYEKWFTMSDIAIGSHVQRVFNLLNLESIIPSFKMFNVDQSSLIIALLVTLCFGFFDHIYRKVKSNSFHSFIL